MTNSPKNATSVAETSAEQTSPQSTVTERDSSGWTIVSKPGAVVEISTRPLPDHIREAVARHLGVGTGEPRPAE